jgi:signal transduction histidine kinase
VTTRRIEGGVEIEVLDDGPGFAPEHADQLFSPFYSTRTTGSGLGLTICRQIIKAHGGVILADNRSEGGARFVVVIPLPRPSGSD